jgi:hypothetical protein
MRKLVAAESSAGTVALALVALGVVGFVPGAVHHYAALHWCGAGSGAELFGVFRTSIALNLGHLGLGVAGLQLARTRAGARTFLSLGGSLVFALGIFGLLRPWNGIPVDRGDDWLHLGLGMAMLYLGLAAALPAFRPAAP